MLIRDTEISCGVLQLSGLDSFSGGYGWPPFWFSFREDTRKAFLQIVEEIESSNKAAFILFSDNVEAGNGRALERFIRRNRLGGLRKSGPKENPNSGNDIEVWVWEHDIEAIHKLVKRLEK